MASPQKENGYTPIANELLEQIYRGRFNSTQIKIILAICRYTYGFSRKSHHLSLTFLAEATGVSKRYVSNELQKLISGKVIKVVNDCSPTESREISLNKHYDEWVGTANVLQMNNTSTGEQSIYTTDDELFTSPVEELFYQDKQYLKQNIKQDARLLFESLWKLYPEKKGKAKVSDKSKLALLKHGYNTVKTCLDRYVADKPDWKQHQHGSTFFTSGYIDYLDENYVDGGSVTEPSESTRLCERGNF